MEPEQEMIPFYSDVQGSDLPPEDDVEQPEQIPMVDSDDELDDPDEED